jgi:hypothetical protein
MLRGYGRSAIRDLTAPGHDEADTDSRWSSGRTGARVLCGLALVVAASLAVASSASASELIDRDASNVQLKLNARGEALLTYTAAGVEKHVLAWGAINAIPPTRGRKQVEFKKDYAGGWGKYHSLYWKNFGGVCLPYAGPALAWKVVACKAPDGSFWALQSWQRPLPNYGVRPSAEQSMWELRLSHWTGAPAVLQIELDWSYRQFDHLFGTYTYNGIGVHGFASTRYGVPLDSFGRNLFVDSYDSAIGPGWQRDNSFLAHGPGGSFCYGFYPHAGRPAAKGEKYRATIQGPGVTPDVMWEGAAPGTYNPVADAAANARIRALNDPKCMVG